MSSGRFTQSPARQNQILSMIRYTTDTDTGIRTQLISASQMGATTHGNKCTNYRLPLLMKIPMTYFSRSASNQMVPSQGRPDIRGYWLHYRDGEVLAYLPALCRHCCGRPGPLRSAMLGNLRVRRWGGDASWNSHQRADTPSGVNVSRDSL